MIFGFALIVLGYTIFYWGLHHFPYVDCPTAKGESGTHCRHSLITLLGLDTFGINQGAAIQYGP